MRLYYLGRRISGRIRRWQGECLPPIELLSVPDAVNGDLLAERGAAVHPFRLLRGLRAFPARYSLAATLRVS